VDLGALDPLVAVVSDRPSPSLAGTVELSIESEPRSTVLLEYPLATSESMTGFQVPSSLHRLCRSQTDLCDPYLGGMSIHLHPVARTKTIPFTVVLPSFLGRPVRAGGGRLGYEAPLLVGELAELHRKEDRRRTLREGRVRPIGPFASMSFQMNYR
jgi:hypothetical protein